MLSHHELATLMLLKESAQRVETLDEDVHALCRYEYAEVHQRSETGERTLQLTERGRLSSTVNRATT